MRCGRRRVRGFTLVELTVALAAGLIVALGIVGLSKEATRTFHEEVRSSAAEAALRTAIDRLRADLQRAGSMSTGNIMGDPKMAKNPAWTSNVQGITVGMAGLRRLAGVHLFDGGSYTNTQTLSALQVPALDPDAIEIGGNMASDEQYVVAGWQPVGNCNRLLLSTTSGAMVRLMSIGAAAAPTELRNQFQPVPAGLTRQFMVRLIDETGRTQYLATCAEAAAASFAGAQPYVDVDGTSTPIITPDTTQTNGGVGKCGGRCIVNPVQIVRWELMSSAQEPAQYVNGLDGLTTNPTAPDTTKYDLVRSYVDAFGAVVPDTTELVAEYAVDLDFAFTVDQGDTTGQNPNLLTFAFDDSHSANWAYDVSTLATPSVIGPQRIRSIRARLVTRTGIPDRTVNIPLTNYGNQDFMYRYCIVPPCATQDDVMRWARTRTVTTEVSLPNLEKDFY
jgi:prepilin-type N-terminal cleavage/methylation domain-containing protein